MHIVLGVDAHVQDTNCGEPSAYINLRKESVVSPRPLIEEKRAEAEAETFLDVHSCHTCSECNARFSSDTSLRAHIADLHTLVQCPQCGVQVIQSTCFIYG